MQLAPLSMDLIDEGRLKRDFDSRLTQLVEEFLLHLDEYGQAAVGSKASISLTVEFKATQKSLRDNQFDVTPKVSTKQPSRPAFTTMAVRQELGLFCLKSGTSEDPPEQLKLATADGRGIDQATGEAEAFAPTPKEIG